MAFNWQSLLGIGGQELFGKKESPFISTLNKGQQQLFDRQTQGYAQGPQSLLQAPSYQAGLQHIMQLLQGGPEATEAFEAPYLRQFNEQTIPHLAEQFSGAGAQSSSAFQQALGQAGAGLQENLAALREGLKFQALTPALQYGQQPFENQQNLIGQSTMAQRPNSFLQQLLISLAGGASQAAGAYTGKKLGM